MTAPLELHPKLVELRAKIEEVFAKNKFMPLGYVWKVLRDMAEVWDELEAVQISLSTRVEELEQQLAIVQREQQQVSAATVEALTRKVMALEKRGIR